MRKREADDVEYLGCDGGDDFISLGRDMLMRIPFKKAAFLLVFMVLIFSNVFINTVLTRIPQALELGVPTTRGTMIQITIIIVAYIVLDILVNEKVI